MRTICWNNLIPPGCSQDDGVRLIKEAFSDENLTDVGRDTLARISRGATRTRFFGGSASGRKSCLQIAGLLLRSTSDPVTGKPYSPEKYPFTEKLAQAWDLLLQNQDDTQRETFSRHLRILLSSDAPTSGPDISCDKKRNTGAHLWDYRTDFSFSAFDLPTALGCRTESGEIQIPSGFSLAVVLAVLSLVASTYYLWNHREEAVKYRMMTDHLAGLLFPADRLAEAVHYILKNPCASILDFSSRTVSPDVETADVTFSASEELFTEITGDFLTTKKRNEDLEAEEAVLKAEEFIHDCRYAEAYALVTDVLERCYFAQNSTRGDALYLLACCCESDTGACPIPESFLSVDDIFREAYFFGCEKARRNISGPDILKMPVRAAGGTPGLCIINEENEPAHILEQTMPVSWTLTCCTDISDALSFLQDDRQIRYVLLSEKEDKNLRDALLILHAYQHASGTSAMLSETPFIPRAELFIRCCREKSEPLIDTALNLLKKARPWDPVPVCVFLIDDVLDSARMLLTRHPYFYRATGRNIRESVRDWILHPVILSSNPDNTMAIRLLQEIFSLPVQKENLRTRITLLSPYATDIRRKMAAASPGMEDYVIPDRKTFSDDSAWPSFHSSSEVRRFRKEENDLIVFSDDAVSPVSLEYQTYDFQSSSLRDAIDRMEISGDLLYYIVDTGNDLDNLALASQIREEGIRMRVRTRRLQNLSSVRPVIAVHCQDPSFSGLAEKLLVPKGEHHSNQWFNNYGFVMFGSLSERYSWDSLGRTAAEQAAECIHLAYSHASVSDTAQIYAALAHYFNRLYLRDSSLSGAASLPYRLFVENIFPDAWFIQDADAWWNSDQRRNLGQQFLHCLYPDPEKPGEENSFVLEELEKFEHLRWRRYMISRGWSGTVDRNGAMDFEQAVQYIRNGAPGHVLQIAKIHPCICSWDDLTELQRRLDYEYRVNAYSQDQNGESFRPDHRFAAYQKTEDGFRFFQSLDADVIRQTASILNLAWFSRTSDTHGSSI